MKIHRIGYVGDAGEAGVDVNATKLSGAGVFLAARFPTIGAWSFYISVQLHCSLQSARIKFQLCSAVGRVFNLPADFQSATA